MTFQPGANVYTQGFGSRPENVEVPHIDVRAPSTSDILYPVGKKWVDSTNNATYELTSFSETANVTTANWQASSGGSAVLSSLTGDSGTATPTLGNIKLAGTANQIVTSASGSTVTFALTGPYTPATYTAHGVLVGEGTSSIVATAAGTDGQVLTGNSGADPAFAAIGTKSGLTAHGVVLAEGTGAFVATGVGGTGTVLAGNSAADPTFQAISELNIVDNTTGTVGAPTTIVVDTTYIADQASVTTGFVLPATASRGQTFVIVGNGPGGWQIQQNANQAIKVGSVTTTTGTGGSLSSGSQYSSVTLRAAVGGASTIWVATGFAGTFTVV